MAHEISFVDNTGSEGVAHWQMLLKIKTLAEANGWTTLRYDTAAPGGTREWIAKGVGLSGTEEIFIGVRAYDDSTADYYNLSVAVFTGYVSGALWASHPGFRESGVCAHNNRIDYWLAVNAQRIMFALKVSAPLSYEVGYAGKYFPYGTPGQYPYPVACIGMLVGAAAVRYSTVSTAHQTGVKGSPTTGAAQQQGAIRDVAGTWQTFWCLPYVTGSASRRDTGGYYQAMKCLLYGAGNLWGELDGIRYVSGFGNQAEYTTTIGGKAQVVIADAERNGIGDYMLMEMD